MRKKTKKTKGKKSKVVKRTPKKLSKKVEPVVIEKLKRMGCVVI